MCPKRAKTIVAIAILSILICGWNAVAGPPQVQAPWKPFVACFPSGTDGKPVAVMVTPGPAPGRWVVVVGGTAVWQITPVVEPVPPVPPAPPGPTPPSLVEEAKRLAQESAQKLPAEGRLEDAQKLAAVYKTLAEQIPGSIDSIDKLITANRYAREIALGPQRAKVWEPWVKELGTWLDAKRTAGTIKTVEDCKPVWLAIGEGLSAVKGGKVPR